MSKHSEKKVIEHHSQPYYQSYVPTPYIPTTYEQPIVMMQQMIPTQIITSEPTIIKEKRVIQAESQFIKQDIQQSCQNMCQPCIQTCIPCQDQEKIVTRQVILKEKQQQPINQDYEKKLNEIERLHIQEIKEMEFKMQQQLEFLQNQKQQEDQQKQLIDLKTSIQDLKIQIQTQKQQQQPQQQQQQQIQPQFYNTLQIEKLENQLQKKKQKIKDLKNNINGLQQELQTRILQIQELEVRLRQPQPQQIVHVPQENYELINQVKYLEQERNSLIREIDQLRVTNSELSLLSFRQDPEKIRLQQDFSRMINDFRLLEQENIKMATIIGQKDELIKSLEQRISVELSRQSLLMQQSSPQRVVLEQTTRPIQYVIDQQPIHKQYIIQDTVQPTLIQQQQTLPNVKILQ